MKIVHVEDFFHPQAGYQLNILAKYMVKLGHEVTVVTGELDKFPEYLTAFFGKDAINEKDAQYSERYHVKIIRVPVFAFISGRAVFSRKIFQIVSQEKPDVLFVHGNDTVIGMQFTKRLKRLGFPLVLDSHMLEMASRNRFAKVFRRFYRNFCTPIIIKNNVPVIRTQDSDYVWTALGIPLTQAPYLSYGSDLMLFHPDDQIRKDFRKSHGIPESCFLIVYAGKLDQSKGGLLLAEMTRERFDARKKVAFLIVGDTVGEYGENVEKLFDESANRIYRLPTYKYTELAQVYQAADAAVFPKQCSLSFFDAQACALPVVFENNEINRGRAERGTAFCFDAGNVSDFRERIKELADIPEIKYKGLREKCVTYIREEYNYEKIVQNYLKIMENAVSGRN